MRFGIFMAPFHPAGDNPTLALERDPLAAALERAGDFSQSAVKPRDPVTNVAFPNNLIPSSRIDPAAKTIEVWLRLAAP